VPRAHNHRSRVGLAVQRWLGLTQGSSLFEDTKFGEELSDLGSVATDCLGDIRRAGGPEKTDRRISDGGHYFGTGALSDPACVLPEGNVTHVMGAILD
jgi:hypothetical protein